MFLDETFVFDKELDLGCRDLTVDFPIVIDELGMIIEDLHFFL